MYARLDISKIPFDQNKMPAGSCEMFAARKILVDFKSLKESTYFENQFIYNVNRIFMIKKTFFYENNKIYNSSYLKNIENKLAEAKQVILFENIEFSSAIRSMKFSNFVDKYKKRYENFLLLTTINEEEKYDNTKNKDNGYLTPEKILNILTEIESEYKSEYVLIDFESREEIENYLKKIDFYTYLEEVIRNLKQTNKEISEKRELKNIKSLEFYNKNREIIVDLLYGFYIIKKNGISFEKISELDKICVKLKEIDKKVPNIKFRLECFILALKEKIAINLNEIKEKIAINLNKIKDWDKKIEGIDLEEIKYQTLRSDFLKFLFNFTAFSSEEENKDYLLEFFMSSPLREEVFYYYIMLRKFEDYFKFSVYKDKKTFADELLGNVKNANTILNGYLRGHRSITISTFNKILERLVGFYRVAEINDMYNYYYTCERISGYLNSRFTVSSYRILDEIGEYNVLCNIDDDDLVIHNLSTDQEILTFLFGGRAKEMKTKKLDDFDDIEEQKLFLITIDSGKIEMNIEKTKLKLMNPKIDEESKGRLSYILANKKSFLNIIKSNFFGRRMGNKMVVTVNNTYKDMDTISNVLYTKEEELEARLRQQSGIEFIKNAKINSLEITLVYYTDSFSSRFENMIFYINTDEIVEIEKVKEIYYK